MTLTCHRNLGRLWTAGPGLGRVPLLLAGAVGLLAAVVMIVMRHRIDPTEPIVNQEVIADDLRTPRFGDSLFSRRALSVSRLPPCPSSTC